MTGFGLESVQNGFRTPQTHFFRFRALFRPRIATHFSGLSRERTPPNTTLSVLTFSVRRRILYGHNQTSSCWIRRLLLGYLIIHNSFCLHSCFWLPHPPHIPSIKNGRFDYDGQSHQSKTDVRCSSSGASLKLRPPVLSRQA